MPKSNMPQGHMERFERIAQETVRQAEKVPVSMDHYVEGLRLIAKELEELADMVETENKENT